MNKVIVIQGRRGMGKTQVSRLIEQIAKGRVHLIDEVPFANDAEKMAATINEALKTGHVIVTRILGKTGGHGGTSYLDFLADVIFTVAGIEKLR